MRRTGIAVIARERDFIGDFETGDVIDLSLIDADKKTPGDQAFDFIGTNVNFTKVAGQLRSVWTADSQIVQADVNDDVKADFAIEVSDPGHAITLSASDLSCSERHPAAYYLRRRFQRIAVALFAAQKRRGRREG